MAKTKIEEGLLRIKEIFNQFAPTPPAPAQQAPAPSPAPSPAPANSNSNATAQYSVDGGVPVYVNISDDGIAGIDQGDSVFTDANMTVPYPDGTYKVTGTDFSFTVAGGAVTAIDDKDGKGAGTPVQAAANPNPQPAQPAQPAPAPKPVPQFKSQEDFKAYADKFDSGNMPSPDDMWAMVKALFENVFGYQINQQKAMDAIALYEENFKTQNALIEKQKTVLQEIFTVVEELSKVPTDEPVEQKSKFGFEKRTEASKDEKLKNITASLRKIKEQTA